MRAPGNGSDVGNCGEAAARRASHLGCPLPIARLFAGRGFDAFDPDDAGAVRRFLEPSIDDLLDPMLDPMLLLGMPAAVRRIQQAVAAAEPILIYGDYDVDGTTATALLKTVIERIAPKDRPAQVRYHVPHRIREGYGMQTNVLGDAAQSGIRLVISVDTGIRAFAAAAEAKLLGLDLIVTDHHLPDDAEGNPEAVAVINPAQAGCPYPFKSLCGAAVAFKLAHALLAAQAVTEAERARLRDVLLPSLLKLVAIATVADSVPLTGENRAIVALGLRALRNPVQPGLRALLQVAKIPPGSTPTATEVGFRLGPRINAAGRMDIAGEVVELLLTRDPERAQTLAEKLDRLNEERRATEARALEAIERELAAISDATKQIQGTNGPSQFPAECIVLDDPEWHRGVLGILASRVVERTGRPALILTHEDGQAHGSGRSIEGFHLLDALTAVHQRFAEESQPPSEHDTAVFTRFGGHAHAVGFSLPSANIDLLRSRLRDHTRSRLTPSLLAPRLECDLELELEEITPEFFVWLERCAPFGIGNPEPIFVSRGARLRGMPRAIKEKHIALQIQRSRGGDLTALGWSRTIDWIARSNDLALREGSIVDIAYRVKQNTYSKIGGLQLELCDLAGFAGH
ncbi:MAG TPA: single-stranded-DNA-specific exonuclease RecJ [Granulicella sp.]|jgi:single-stranded-DNA-specific exonuclease|nr:single-stranded-DNA-specific exonuclease RecJ [Granulicella sp.]